MMLFFLLLTLVGGHSTGEGKKETVLLGRYMAKHSTVFLQILKN